MQIKNFLLLGLLVACQSNSSKLADFDSTNFPGKYEVDMSCLTSEIFKAQEGEDNSDKFSRLLVDFAFSSIDAHFYFNEDQTGILEFSGGILDIVSQKEGGDRDTMLVFQYQIKEDSLIYIKEEGETEFAKRAVIKQYSGNYDHIEMDLVDENEDKSFRATCSLVKVK